MKNIFKKVRNNMEYNKWMKIKEEALLKAAEHSNDEDDIEFRYWVTRYLMASDKCYSIDID